MKNIVEIIENQRGYFATHQTLDVNFRKKQLLTLLSQIKKHENEIIDAIKLDLNKSEFESYATEIGIIYEELNFMIKNLERFAKRKVHKTPLVHFPSRSYTYYDPFGCVLIMSPWNYPFQLTIAPLVGAIAAGNCAIIKPSNYSANTSAVIEKILSIFPDEYIAVVQGGRAENTQLLEQKFDYIFFTGSPSVGKLVMEKAAKHLTPFTLELGGKSPCIIDKTANLQLAAKRIVWGKLLNSGQTCVAPDYLLVEEDVKAELISYINDYIKDFFGENPETNTEYPKIINQKHFARLCKLIPDELLKVNAETLQIAPVILADTSWNDEIMEEEIFGPILPILTFKTIAEAINEINRREKPLALYLFTTDCNTEREILTKTFFGGGCVNDTIIHVSNNHIPFGGIGNSGIGKYHGKDSFYSFSHTKSIMKKSNLLDLNVRYAPYQGKIKLLRKIMK